MWAVAVAAGDVEGARAEAIVTAEHEGRCLLYAVDLDSGAHREVGATGAGSWDVVALVPGRREVVGVRSDLLTPPEPFVCGLDDGAPRALAALSGFVAPAAMPTVRTLAVEVAPDGSRARTMQAFVVEPAGSIGAAGGATRTVLWVHGGPVYAWLAHWHWRWSALVMAAAGYRVVLPNPAGSTGFGIDWVNDIWGNTWGGRCYDDLMRLVAALEREGVAARDVAVMGGSFGGYMANWIGSQGPRFRALVAHASIFQMSAFHGVTDVPAWWELMMGGVPWDADSDYDRWSPSKGIARWATPTLILHGERDYRVPIGEALALFEALQRRGVPSELVVFPDENHWVLKPKNAVAWYGAVLGFLARAFDEARPGRAT